MHCCDGLCNGINRVFNLVLMLAGICVCGFGVFLASLTSFQFDYFTISIISVSTFLSLLTGLYTCCGHTSYLYSTFYIYSSFLLVLGDATAAGLVFTQKQNIIASLKKELGPKNSKFLDENNITITGYIAASLACLQILALVLAYCHRNILIDIERERLDLDDGYDTLLDNDNTSRTRRTSELVASRTTKSRDVAPQKEETEGAKAASKYRSKYADLYSKYGIDKNDNV